MKAPILFWVVGALMASTLACGPSDSGTSGDGTGGAPAGTGGAPGGSGSSAGSDASMGASGGAGSGGTVGSGGAGGSGGTVGGGGSTGAGGTGGPRGSGGSGETGGTSGASGGAAGQRGASGGAAGRSTDGSGGRSASGGTAGRSAPGGGGGSGGGTGGAPGSGGTMATCSARASTSTRPQLSSADAANYTVQKYLAQSDGWDPTGGLGSADSFTPDFTVAADRTGTHTTVKAALAAASGSTRRYVLVKPGTYRETISVAGSTPITIYGATTDATKVVIVNDASATSAGGTAQSATFTSKAGGLQLMNLTISNDFATPSSGSNIQAVALYTTGDKTVLQNVRLHGFQDTLYTDSASDSTPSRVYIKGSFIEGDTDFIFGSAILVIDGGTINYLSSRKGTGSGVHLAPSTRVANARGFLVTGATFTADASAPANKISLGRSWDQGSVTPTPNGQAIIRESILGAHINKTAPWTEAATSGRAYSATGNRFNEYCNTGPGAGP